MNVTCPNCATVYRVDPAKVPEAGVRARCAVCSAVFAVNPEGQPGRTPEPAAAVAPAPSAGAATAPRQTVPRQTVPRETVPQEATPASPREPPRPEPPKAEPARAEPGRIDAHPTQPPRVVPPAAAPRTAHVAPAAGPAGVPTRPAAPARPTPATPPAAPVAPAQPPAHPPPRPAASQTGARPVNPFLSQDPALKARRLARALISDMVVYHPAKRQEGLRDGTLKELFEEEIKKSWEEYSEQVGKNVAESSGYFREALNEILAGGRQIF